MLAEMTYTLTDCCVDQLKNSKQIKKAIVYGLAVNYSSKKAEVLKIRLFLTGQTGFIYDVTIVEYSHVCNIKDGRKFQ